MARATKVRAGAARWSHHDSDMERTSPGTRSADVVVGVQRGSVSRSSTLPIFREACDKRRRSGLARDCSRNSAGLCPG